MDLSWSCLHRDSINERSSQDCIGNHNKLGLNSFLILNERSSQVFSTFLPLTIDGFIILTRIKKNSIKLLYFPISKLKWIYKLSYIASYKALSRIWVFLRIEFQFITHIDTKLSFPPHRNPATVVDRQTSILQGKRRVQVTRYYFAF